MNFIEQNIKGLYLIEPQLYNDNRGLFYESWTINELNKRISKKINPNKTLKIGKI